MNASTNRSTTPSPCELTPFFARYGAAFQQRERATLLELFRTPLPIVTPYATIPWNDEQAVSDGLDAVFERFDVWRVLSMTIENLQSTPAGPMHDVVIDWRLDTEWLPRTFRTGYWVTPMRKGLGIAAMMLIEEPRERPLL